MEDVDENRIAAPANLQFAALGQRLRYERTRQRIGLRELARRVGVSGSAISQIERGRTNPSVATLHRMARHLGLSADELLAAAETGVWANPADSNEQPSATSTQDVPAGIGGGPVLRRGEGDVIHLDGGVTWERLRFTGEGAGQFLLVTYDASGESTPADQLLRYSGHEHGYVLEGSLEVTLGFTTHKLDVGDSIAFESATPHRVFNPGSAPAKAIWYLAS